MKQIFNLLPNHVYRIKSKISVTAIEIYIVRFETHKEYNSVMNGANYVKYMHHRKRYIVPVTDNMFKTPDFKIRDKTIFFITPNVEISKGVERKQLEKTVKEDEKEQIEKGVDRRRRVKNFDTSCSLCVLEHRTKHYFNADAFIILDCDSCHIPMIVYSIHNEHPQISTINEAHAKAWELFGIDTTFRSESNKILNHYHEHIERKANESKVDETGEVNAEIEKEAKMASRDYKPHVAIFNTIYGRHPFGGPAVYGYNVVSMLAKANLDFKMFYTSPPHAAYIRGYEHFVRPLSEFNPNEFNVFYVMNGFQIVDLLTKNDISPVIVGSNLVPNSLPKFCYQVSAPVISDRKEKTFVRQAKGVFWLAQSHYQEREYRRLGLPWKMPVLIAPNPVNTDMFRPNEEDKNVDICWTGKDTWAKGVPILRQVVKTNKELRFFIISEDKINITNNSDNIQWVLGRTIFELKDVLPKAKLFLITSYKEFQPLALLEAMSCGLPPIGFKTSGVDEIIRDGYNGISVDCFGCDHLQIAIQTLLENDDLRIELGRKAREYVIKHHGYKACAKLYKELFERAIKAKNDI